MADDDENFAPLQSSAEIVGEMSFSQVKADSGVASHFWVVSPSVAHGVGESSRPTI